MATQKDYAHEDSMFNDVKNGSLTVEQFRVVVQMYRAGGYNEGYHEGRNDADAEWQQSVADSQYCGE